MDSPEELARLEKGLERMRVSLLELMRDTADPRIREQMQVAADRLQDQAIPYVRDYPRLKAEVVKRLAETKRSAQETIARAEELQARAAELEAQAKIPPPPPPAPPPPDPLLGGQLRDELLKLFADSSDQASRTGSTSLWSALKKH